MNHFLSLVQAVLFCFTNFHMKLGHSLDLEENESKAWNSKVVIRRFYWKKKLSRTQCSAFKKYDRSNTYFVNQFMNFTP